MPGYLKANPTPAGLNHSPTPWVGILYLKYLCGVALID
jgi:hypothetical protein